MPRKTGQGDAHPGQGADASMRPRPDAAENREIMRARPEDIDWLQ